MILLCTRCVSHCGVQFQKSGNSTVGFQVCNIANNSANIDSGGAGGVHIEGSDYVGIAYSSFLGNIGASGGSMHFDVRIFLEIILLLYVWRRRLQP